MVKDYQTLLRVIEKKQKCQYNFSSKNEFRQKIPSRFPAVETRHKLWVQFQRQLLQLKGKPTV